MVNTDNVPRLALYVLRINSFAFGFLAPAKRSLPLRWSQRFDGQQESASIYEMIILASFGYASGFERPG